MNELMMVGIIFILAVGLLVCMCGRNESEQEREDREDKRPDSKDDTGKGDKL